MAKPNQSSKPEASFVEKANMDLSFQTNVADEVAKLAASLGVTLKGKAGEYEPDAFLGAIIMMRGQLMEAKGLLQEQADRQAAREVELDQREADVSFREKRANALDKLNVFAETKPERGFFGKLFR